MGHIYERIWIIFDYRMFMKGNEVCKEKKGFKFIKTFRGRHHILW
jgi:hypothetical protein